MTSQVNGITIKELKQMPSITEKVLDQFKICASKHRYVKCNCECHNCNILNMRKHNAITIISRFQCLECPCPPIQFNADEFDTLRLHLRIAWRKHKQTEYPVFLKNEKMLLDILVLLNLEEEKTILEQPKEVSK